MERPTIRPLEAEPSRVSPVERFIGYNRVHQVADALGVDRVEINALYFEPGARARPHRHNADQVIVFLDGPGIIAVDGGPDQLVPPGEFVMLPAHVPHMHGAPDSHEAMHISIMPDDHDSDFLCEIAESWKHFRHGGDEPD